MRKIVELLIIMGIATAVWAVEGNKPDVLMPVNGGRTTVTLNDRNVIFHEDFEDGVIPDGWTVVDGNNDGYTWTAGTTDDLGYIQPPNYGTCYAYYSDFDAGIWASPSVEILTTPAISTGGLTHLTLSFSYSFYAGQYDAFIVLLSTSNGVDTLDIYAGSNVGDALYILDGYLPTDSVKVSFIYVDQGGWNQAVAIDNVTLTDEAVEIHDVAVVRCEYSNYPFMVNTTDQIDFVIANYGNVDETDVTVELSVNDITDTVVIPSLPAGDSTTVSITYTPIVEEVITILCNAVITEDNDPTNNGYVAIEYAYPEGTVWAEGFEYIDEFPPPDWAVINNDGGDNTWGRTLYYPHSGYYAAADFWEASHSDDWLITGPITPEESYYDSIGFFYSAFDSYCPEDLQVWAMGGQDVADTLALLWEVVNNMNTYYQRQTVSIDNFDGMTIYIGFRSLSPNGYYNLLDDIFYMKVEAPTAVEEAGVERGPGLTARGFGRDIVVTFALPEDMDVKVSLYDVSGRHIMNLASGRYAAGSHSVTVNSEALKSGIYIVSLRAGSQVVTKKVAVIH